MKEADKARQKAKAKVLHVTLAVFRAGQHYCCCLAAVQCNPCLHPLAWPLQAAEDKTFGLKNKNKSAKVAK
jgi:hypothetical protein